MRFDSILNLVCFLKFWANLKYALYYALKSCENIRLQKNTQSCTDLILEVWYASWKLWHQSLCSKKYLGNTMVPILLWNSPYSPIFFNGPYINGAYKCYITAKRGTPVVPKKIFRKIYTLSFLTPCQSTV